jgi:hypothetical protein
MQKVANKLILGVLSIVFFGIMASGQMLADDNQICVSGPYGNSDNCTPVEPTSFLPQDVILMAVGAFGTGASAIGTVGYLRQLESKALANS